MKKYPYANNKMGITHGIAHNLDETVPETVREANDKIAAARNAEHVADTEVGRLTVAAQAAAEADTRALGEALADGQDDPGSQHLDQHAKELAAANRQAKASRVATQIAAERLGAALDTAKSNGTLHEAVKALHERTTSNIARCQQLLNEAQRSRDAALADRETARFLDAWPRNPRDFEYTPEIGDGDTWRAGLNQINTDLASITESLPLSLIPPPETPRNVTKKEGSFAHADRGW